MDQSKYQSLAKMDPRTFGEVIATLILASEARPQAGRHTISMEEMMAVNKRWREHPGVGQACIRFTDVNAINTGLTVVYDGIIQIVSRNADGSVVVE